MSNDSYIDWNLKEMRALHHVIQLGTVTAAAERMGLSQPAVSRLISSLENKLGLPLFERQGRILAPTTSAMEFFSASLKVFEAVDNMNFNANASQERQVLRIAAPPTYTQGFLQDAVALFLKTNKNITVEIDVRSSPAIFDMITEGHADLGISDNIIRHEAIRSTPFRQAQICCFMRKDHPLAQHKEIDFSEIDEIDLIGLTYRHASRTAIDRLLIQHNVKSRIVVRTSTASSAVSFVRSTGAVAFLSPFPIGKEVPEDIIVRPVPAGLEYTTRFIYPTRIGIKPLTRRFMRSIRILAAQHDEWSKEIT